MTYPTDSIMALGNALKPGETITVPLNIQFRDESYEGEQEAFELYRDEDEMIESIYAVEKIWGTKVPRINFVIEDCYGSVMPF